MWSIAWVGGAEGSATRTDRVVGEQEMFRDSGEGRSPRDEAALHVRQGYERWKPAVRSLPRSWARLLHGHDCRDSFARHSRRISVRRVRTYDNIIISGRYDNLIGMFSTVPVPSIGFSIGIERIFSILEQKYLKDPNVTIRENPSDCIVASIPSKTMDMTPEKMRVYSLLWDAGIKCDFNYRLNWNLGK